jgi:Translation initiation factor IF-2, N-terminal region
LAKKSAIKRFMDRKNVEENFEKVRVYDLAKELRRDTKLIVQELRRAGADVEVPSNYVSKELANLIRNKYSRKLDVAPMRAIKIIKNSDVSGLERYESSFQQEEIRTYNCTICSDFKCNDQKQLERHINFCKDKSEDKIEKPIPEKTIEKPNYIHLPIPQQKGSKKMRCKNCGDAFPMPQSNICYQCKDK